MQIAVYDMDKTITRTPSWTRWLLFYARTEAPLRLLLVPLMLVPTLGYVLGGLDRKELKQATQWLLMGARAPRRRVERAADAFAAQFGARMELPQALAAMAADRAAGRAVWVATASCRYFAAALARRWPVDRLIATENIWHGDFLSHRIRGENCYGIGKLRMIVAVLDERPEWAAFVSDHPSDLPALLWADEPVAANPAPELRAMAAARGWRICDWA